MDSNEPKSGEFQIAREKLVSLAQPSRAASLLKSLDDPNYSDERFFEDLPDSALSVSMGLCTPFFYSKLRESAPDEDSRRQLDETRTLIDHHLKPILEHPRVVKRFLASQQDTKPLAGVVFPAFVASFHVIHRISHLSMALRSNDGFLPVVRVGFADQTGRLLLDSMLSWHDLSFAIEGLSSILVQDMRSAELSLRGVGIKHGAPPEDTAGLIQQAMSNLEAIAKLSPKLGITGESATTPHPANADDRE